jgi:hypothetical protein
VEVQRSFLMPDPIRSERMPRATAVWNPSDSWNFRCSSRERKDPRRENVHREFLGPQGRYCKVRCTLLQWRPTRPAADPEKGNQKFGISNEATRCTSLCMCVSSRLPPGLSPCQGRAWTFGANAADVSTPPSHSFFHASRK